MASPFTVFRKNQKVFLAITAILAMIAFVFLDSCVRSSSPTQAYENPTVVSWKFGDITEYEMDNRVSMRRILNQFIAGAMSLAGQQREMRPTFSESEDEIVRSMVLARRGHELGLVISDEMVNRVIEEVTFNRVRPADLERVAASYRLGGQRVTPKQIFDALREELLASRVAMLFLNGLGVAGEDYLMPLDTPAERWDNFRRLERQAIVQVLPVPVAEFTEEVGQPSNEELLALFEKYKARFPSPDSPDPGFRQPYRARFQYFKADIDELVTAEMERVSEDEVREYYEKNKDSQFRKSKLSPLDEDDAKAKAEKDGEKSEDPQESEPSDAKDGAAEPAGDKKDSEDSGAKEAKPSEGANDQKPVTPQDSAANEGASETAKDEKDESAQETKKTSATGDAEPVTKDSPQDKSSEEKSAQARSGNPFRHVAFQDEKAQKDEAAKPDPQVNQDAKTQTETDAAKSEPATESQKDDAKSAKGSEGFDDPAKQGITSKGNGSAKDGSAKDGSAKDAGAKDAGAKDGSAKVETAPADAGKEPAAEATGPEPFEYRPLEEVEEEIRRSLARERVQTQVDERLEKLRAEMSRYSSAMIAHRRAAAKNPDEPRPKPFELESLAEKYGVRSFATEFLSLRGAEADANLDIAKSRDMNPRSPNFFQPWTQIVFQPKGLFRAVTTREPVSGASFLAWKTEEREGNIPEFKEVRGEVLEAWKRDKARDLAKKKAEEYAGMVRQAKQPMAKVFAQEKNLPVKEVGPFAWFTRPNVPFEMMQQLPPVQYPQIPGVEIAGEEFMETAFDLQPGEVGVALNTPQSIAYVIQVVKFDPSDAVLEQEFLVRMRDYERYRAAGSVKVSAAQTEWMESLLTEYGVDWRRPPDLRLAREE